VFPTTDSIEKIRLAREHLNFQSRDIYFSPSSIRYLAVAPDFPWKIARQSCCSLKNTSDVWKMAQKIDIFFKNKSESSFPFKTNNTNERYGFKCAIFRGEESCFRRILRFAKIVKNNAGWFVIQLHVTFANLCISPLFAQEIDLLVSEESMAIIRHILMWSFDAVYRMDGKTFRAFVSQEFCGGQASNVYSKLYSIYFTDGAVHPVYDINILTEVRPGTCFSRFPTRSCGYGSKLCFPSLLIRHFAD